MNSIKNIVAVFDFDGVVAMDAGGPNGVKVFSRLGLECTEGDFFDMYNNIGRTYVKCLAATGANTPEKQREWFLRVYLPTWRQFAASSEASLGATLFPGIATVLANLSSRGISPLIVSNNNIEYIRGVLVRNGIGNRFSGVMADGFDSSLRPKPATDMVHAGFMEYCIGHAGKKIVLVGDTFTDLKLSHGLAIEGHDIEFVGTYYDEATKNEQFLKYAGRVAMSPIEIFDRILEISGGR